MANAITLERKLNFGDTDARRLVEEARYAIGQLPPGVLRDLAVLATRLFGRSFMRRLVSPIDLMNRLSKVGGEEASRLLSALRKGEGRAYTDRRAKEILAGGKRFLRSAGGSATALARKLQDEPLEIAPQLAVGAIGLLAGSGGLDADGGIPDLDLAAGIGYHRSILTHSIIAGSVVEALLFSGLITTKVLHQHLPREHARVWDQMIPHAERATFALLTGVSLGLAYHLAIDATIDGMTAYKDLPFSMSLGGHNMLLGLNALAEALGGRRKIQKSTVTTPAPVQAVAPRPPNRAGCNPPSENV